jgi:hypothetical protein
MLRRLWLTLREPRVATACFAVAWWAVLTVGLVAVSTPPYVVASEIGPVLTAVWGWFLLAGGALGVVGALSGWWWIERSGILAAGTGALIYVIVLATLTPPGARLVVIGLVCVILAGMAARWHMISGAQTDPGRRPRDHH